MGVHRGEEGVSMQETAMMVQQDGYDLYALHRSVWSAFGQKDRRDFIYTFGRTDDGVVVVVRSDCFARDWSGTVCDVGVPVEGLQAHFRLRAAPAHGRYHQRWPENDGDRIAWLVRSAERIGCAMVRAKVLGVRKHVHKDRIPLTAVTYEGVLEVRDSALLQHALATGIGRSKAFAMGMVCLEGSMGFKLLGL